MSICTIENKKATEKSVAFLFKGSMLEWEFVLELA